MSDINITKNLNIVTPFTDCSECYNYDPEITSYECSDCGSEGYSYEQHTIGCKHADACLNLYHRKIKEK